MERVAQETDLTLAADERPTARARDIDAEARPRFQRFPDGDRLRLALCLHRLARLVQDRLLRRPVRRLVDQDPVDGRGGLQAGGGVHDVARGHALAFGGPRAERDERLSRGDGDSHLQVALLDDPVADRERRANRPLGIVLVSGRRAEQRHHRVADELLDRPAAPLELGAQARVVRLEHGAHVLWVELLGTRGEADEVGEEDGHDLALLACGLDRLLQTGAAARAEARAVRVLVAAAGTGEHQCSRSTAYPRCRIA